MAGKAGLIPIKDWMLAVAEVIGRQDLEAHILNFQDAAGGKQGAAFEK